MIDLSYLAGIVDGEGCFSITGRDSTSMSPSLTVTMTDSTVPKLFHETFGGTLTLRKPQRENWKSCTQWILRGAKLQPVIKQLLPYLKLKQLHAQVCLQYCKTLTVPGKHLDDDRVWVLRYRLLDLITELNRKGVNSDS